MQNRDNTLKYKINQENLLSLYLKIKITTTEPLKLKKYFLVLGKV